MKLGRWLSTAALSLFLGVFLLGTAALLQAQDQREESKPSQPEATKPSQQEEHTSRPEEDAKQPKQQESKPQDRETQNAQPSGNDDKAAKREDAKPQPEQENKARGDDSKRQATEHMQENGNQHGGRIPDDKFHASFGRQHTFVMHQTTVVEGRPTFQYGGYSFNLVDAWPVGWAYTDQCYIDYIDGEYFLFDLAHPGVRIAIVVVM
jgi:hypothetical protein